MEEDDCKNGKSTFPLDYNVSNPTEFHFGKIGRMGPLLGDNPIHRRVFSFSSLMESMTLEINRTGKN